MSYDVQLVVDTGGPELVLVEDVGNYTSNVAPIFEAALLHPLSELDGRRGTEVRAAVSGALRTMEREQERFEAMNPLNGWGDAKGAYTFLMSIYAACERHPRATVKVYR
jgi:hypothetical protein